jgi:hypothetical protein
MDASESDLGTRTQAITLLEATATFQELHVTVVTALPGKPCRAHVQVPENDCPLDQPFKTKHIFSYWSS